MCPSTWNVSADLIRTITPLASIGLVVLGWALVNRQNNKRESRKETRQLIDRTLKHLAEAVDIATKYQSNSIDAMNRYVEGWKLLLALGQISGSINTLRKKGIDPTSCAAPYINLKKCITGADFMTSNSKPWPPDDKRWLELLAATNSLTETLDRLFIDSFKD